MTICITNDYQLDTLDLSALLNNKKVKSAFKSIGISFNKQLSNNSMEVENSNEVALSIFIEYPPTNEKELVELLFEAINRFRKEESMSVFSVWEERRKLITTEQMALLSNLLSQFDETQLDFANLIINSL